MGISQSPSPDATLTNELAVALVPLRRRAFGDSAVRFALLAAGSWAGAVCVLLAWSKVRPTANVAFIAGCLGAGAVLVGCAAWVVRRPGIVEVARLADARLGLDERLASALCFAGAPGEMEARLRADAAGAALRHKPAEAFPLGRHQRLAVAATMAGLVAVALAVTPNPQGSALARRASNEAVVAQARRAVAQAEKQLGHPTSPQARQLSAALQKALSQLDKAGTPIASLVALSDLSRQLAAIDNSSTTAEQAALAAEAAAGDSLAGAGGAGNVARDLSSANLNAAAAGLRALANELPRLSQAQRTALAAALARAASAAGGQGGNSETGSSGPAGAASNEGFAPAIGKASAALLAGHVGAASKALRAAASGAAASQAAVSLQQQLGAIQAEVRNEAARVASQAQADIGSASRTATPHSTVGHSTVGNSTVGGAGSDGLSAGSTPGAASQTGSAMPARPASAPEALAGPALAGAGQAEVGQAGAARPVPAGPAAAGPAAAGLVPSLDAAPPTAPGAPVKEVPATGLTPRAKPSRLGRPGPARLRSTSVANRVTVSRSSASSWARVAG